MHPGLLCIGAGRGQGGQPSSGPALYFGGNAACCLFRRGFRPVEDFIFLEDREEVFVARHVISCLCPLSAANVFVALQTFLSWSHVSWPAPGIVFVVQSSGQEVNPAFCILVVFIVMEALPKQSALFCKKKER
jgi:hypothetical protein